MQKETMTAAEIEAAIRGMVRQTECTITIADDPTGWHATVGGWGTTAEVSRMNVLVMHAEAKLKPLYDLREADPPLPQSERAKVEQNNPFGSNAPGTFSKL